MRIYAQPRKGYCASCELALSGPPVYRRDETYCCLGCAEGGPCICSYDADLAADGVDGLGLPFAVEVPSPVTADARVLDLAEAPSGRLGDRSSVAAR
jgi:hypothetical protein